MSRTRFRRKPKGEFPFVWNRGARPKGRKGQACKITGWKDRGQGLCLIEFRDGAAFIVQRGGLKRADH